MFFHGHWAGVSRNPDVGLGAAAIKASITGNTEGLRNDCKRRDARGRGRILVWEESDMSHNEDMKVSKGQSPGPAINSCGRLLDSLHGSGSTILIPCFDCDSHEPLIMVHCWFGDGGAEHFFSTIRGPPHLFQ